MNISDTRNSTPVQSGRLSKRYINTSLTPCQLADKSGKDGEKNGGTEGVSDVVRSSERLRNSKVKSKFYKPNNVEKSMSISWF